MTIARLNEQDLSGHRTTGIVPAEDDIRVLLGGAETAGRFAVVERLVTRGQEPPLHLHTREDHLIYLIEGEALFVLGDRTERCVAGSCIYLPRGLEHSYIVEGEEVRLLIVLTPAGLEECFREIRGNGGTTIECLVTVAATYGVEITGPVPERRSG